MNILLSHAHTDSQRPTHHHRHHHHFVHKHGNYRLGKYVLQSIGLCVFVYMSMASMDGCYSFSLMRMNDWDKLLYREVTGFFFYS